MERYTTSKRYEIPKGVNQECNVTFTEMVYTYDTWELNGGDLYVVANNTADIYDIRCLV